MIINDPIHGNIELHPLLVKIIDTPQFQRLRNIKQLGGTYLVYPGASHNRFEHSIGVCHLAGRLVRALKHQISEGLVKKGVEITDEDELCVEIAALCHDLGHGPFSHLFDVHVIPMIAEKNKKNRESKTWKHEKGSIDMLEHMLEKNEDLKKAFKDYKINDEKNLKFIKEMIYGPLDDCKNNASDWRYGGRTKEKRFLYEIVSNDRNGIDVDKWDYFKRDSYMLGIGDSFNFDRCIAFARVIEVNGETQICYRDKEATNLYDMFHTRLLLHQRAYQHKTVNIIERMIADALVKADRFITFKGKNGQVCLSETIYDMEAYTCLTDDVIYRILEKDSTEENVKEAKEIINRVLSRKLYRCVGEKTFNGGTFDKKEIKGIEKSMARIKNLGNIGKDGIIDLVNFNYGKKHENPLDYVNFYTKNKPDSAGPRKREEVSLLLPKVFEEQLVRLYWKKELDKDNFDKIKRAFDKWADTKIEEQQKERCPSCNQEIKKLKLQKESESEEVHE